MNTPAATAADKRKFVSASDKRKADLIAQNFFIYSAIFETGIIAGGSASRTITIQNNSDFEVIKLSYALMYSLAAPDTLTGLAVPGVTVMITEAGSAEPWMDQPVPVYSLFGSGQLPFQMPYTKIMKRKRQLVITAYNIFTGQNIAYLDLSFIGKRIYSARGVQ